MQVPRFWVLLTVFGLLLSFSAHTTLGQDETTDTGTTDTTIQADDESSESGEEGPVASDEAEAESTAGDPEATPQTEEAPPNALKRFEAFVDDKAGIVVGHIASVLFYEFIGRQEFSTEVTESPIVTDSFSSLVKQVSDKYKPDENESWSADFVRAKLSDSDVAAFDASVAEIIDTVRPLVDQAGQELDPNEADMSITVPDGSLTKVERTVLSDILHSEFAVSRLKKFSVAEGDEEHGNKTLFSATKSGIPIIVAWLVAGATFFTVRMGFINFRGFRHAISVTAGKYDDPNDEGEVSHFQALTAALSATVGLGNIAGVAVAVGIGGPGATFWMIIAGILGMSSKFVECSLGQMYREVRPDGRIMGGAMYYLSRGLKELGLGPLGAVLGGLFAALCVFASFGGGNAFQVNQSVNAVQETFGNVELLQGTGGRLLMGIVLAILVGIVIIGGIKRIAATAEKIVPLMCGVYVLACLFILLKNAGAVPDAISTIVTSAFTPAAGYGAMIGVLIQGFRRAAFSNEAGVGSAAIAHSAAKTEYPVREGVVALLGPFIDTVVVCTMTALVIVITGAYDLENPVYRDLILSKNGAAMTTAAMRSQIPWFPYILSAAVLLFAYSTMISWSYYGERCWAYLFGDSSSLVYKIIFIIFVVLGSVMSATNVLDLSDLMILGMAFPNILGVALLSGKVRRALDEYWKKLANGEFDQPVKSE